jgi:hypothetical protein
VVGYFRPHPVLLTDGKEYSGSLLGDKGVTSLEITERAPSPQIKEGEGVTGYLRPSSISRSSSLEYNLLYN